jgi:ABC-2 type transport system permease protein
MMTKANVISMAILLFLIVGGSITAAILTGGPTTVPTLHLGVASSSSDLTAYLETSANDYGVTPEIRTMTEDDARAILDGTIPDADPLEAFVGGPLTSPRVILADPDDARTQGIITSAIQSRTLDDSITAMGGDPHILRDALAESQPSFESPGLSESEKYGPEYAVAMVALVLLLIVLITGCQMIAMGVVEEKSSRVVEILLATIKPTQLLAGKILGVGAYGLFQVAVLGGAIVGSLIACGLVDQIDVPLGGPLALLLVWFLLGYTVFALLFGAVASLVSRQEDIGAVTTPLTFLVLGPYYVSMFLVPEQPDSNLVRILSEIPILSPFMMPMRDALGSVPAWEMGLAILLTIATIPGLVWIAARIYRRGVLHMGTRMKIGDALKRSA